MAHLFGFPYIFAALALGLLYLASSLLFLRADRLSGQGSPEDNNYKLVSANPTDTVRALKRIWTAKYKISAEPRIAALLLISRVSLSVYAVMILTLIWFVIWGPA